MSTDTTSSTGRPPASAGVLEAKYVTTGNDWLTNHLGYYGLVRYALGFLLERLGERTIGFRRGNTGPLVVLPDSTIEIEVRIRFVPPRDEADGTGAA